MESPRKLLFEERASLVTVSVVTIAAFCVAAALAYTRAVLVPFVLAMLVFYLVAPVADLLESKVRFPRWLSTLVVMLLVAAGIFLVALLFLTSLRTFAASAGLYKGKLAEVVVLGAAWLQERGLPLSPDEVLASLEIMPMQDMMQGAAVGALTLISNGTLVTIFVIFLLLGRRAVSSKSAVFRQIDHNIRRYLIIKFLVSALTGFLVWVILTAFGLELALVIAITTFVLNFIPSIGSIIATLLPIPIALVQFETLGPVIAIVVLCTTVQMVVGNGLDPMLMGQNLDLSPVTIVAALVFWGLLWGVVGMLLAAPLTAILRIVLGQFETTRPMGEILAGRLPTAGFTTEMPTTRRPPDVGGLA
jgi:AI-2 transport protein TqsA